MSGIPLSHSSAVVRAITQRRAKLPRRIASRIDSHCIARNPSGLHLLLLVQTQSKDQWTGSACDSLVKGNPLECRCYVGIAIFDISIAIGIGGILQEAAVDEHGPANIQPTPLGPEPCTRACLYLVVCNFSLKSIGLAPRRVPAP